MKYNAPSKILLACVWILSGCSSSDAPVAKPVPLPKIENPLSFEFDTKDAGKKMSLPAGVQRPLILEKQWVVGDGKGSITAYSLEDQTKLWDRNLKLQPGFVVGGDDRLIIAINLDGKVFALNAMTGETEWTFNLKGEVLAAPAMTSEYIIFQQADGAFSALTLDGEQRWQKRFRMPSLSLRGTNTPVVFQNVIIAGLASGKLVAMDVDTGEVRWERQIVTAEGSTEIERLVDLDVPLAIRDNIVFAAGTQGPVIAFEVITGRALWERKLASPAVSLESRGDYVFVADTKGHLWCLNALVGDIVWRKTEYENRILHPLKALGSSLIFADAEGYLHWVDQKTGKPQGSKNWGDAPYGASTSLNKTSIFFQSRDADVIRISEKD
ncbi:MAG: PQQ-binding-like beta-propeller repeat protein [Pseudomonadota bacterium]